MHAGTALRYNRAIGSLTTVSAKPPSLKLWEPWSTTAIINIFITHTIIFVEVSLLNMSSITIYLTLILVALANVSNAWWGSLMSIQANPISNPYINHVYTSLIVPPAPSTQENILSLWPGLYTTGTFGQGTVQTFIMSYGDPAEACGGQIGDWCVMARYLNTSTGSMTSANMKSIGKGAPVVVEYTYNYNAGSYTQISVSNGAVLSYETAGFGVGYIFSPTVQCDGNAIGTVPAHTYVNTTIILALHDPNFNTTATINFNNANMTDMTTNDGGKTWFISEINMFEGYCGPSEPTLENPNAEPSARFNGIKENIVVPIVKNGSSELSLPRLNSSLSS
ncbi:hypothetical protein EV356DRAFT_497375 [Viridothelium virens]|uniref:Uncharacterized protein n=1 Tax=Viridothelium virens TaxID=1048519 RepID=A0A6A6HGA9_VIRVR|nr:hypothetical protein EV356DRAFT_497375 [Viridothelium virens]